MPANQTSMTVVKPDRQTAFEYWAGHPPLAAVLVPVHRFLLVQSPELERVVDVKLAVVKEQTWQPKMDQEA
jgi:hypothetical protein